MASFSRPKLRRPTGGPTEAEKLALNQQRFAFDQQKKAANYMEEAYKATLPTKPATMSYNDRQRATQHLRQVVANQAERAGETLTAAQINQRITPFLDALSRDATGVVGSGQGGVNLRALTQRFNAYGRAPQTGAPTGGGIPQLTGGGAAGGGYSILPYNQGAAGGGGTVNYPSLGGGAYPAPGTMAPNMSFYMQGTAGDPAAAIQETKDIYNQIVPYQKGAVGQYAGELYGAEGQMHDVAAGYAQREQDLSQLLEGYGEHELGRIEQRREQLRAQAKQDMLSRGITSTSAYDASMRGIEQSAADQIRGYQDALTRQKMDYMSMLTGDTLQARAGAAGFAADQAGSRFGASQVPTQSMERLASLLAQQRSDAARILTSGQDIGLGYAQLAESARQAAQGRLLSQAQGTMQTGLGYADLASQLRIANAGI